MRSYVLPNTVSPRFTTSLLTMFQGHERTLLQCYKEILDEKKNAVCPI